jgi:mRNA interferase MazF
MRRGDVVVTAAPGDYGKPRPALVVQSEVFSEISSVVVCLMTTDLEQLPSDLRLTVEPAGTNGLRERSQVMIDKLLTVPIGRVRGPIGSLTQHQMRAVSHGLTVLLGLGGQP